MRLQSNADYSNVQLGLEDLLPDCAHGCQVGAIYWQEALNS